MVELMSMIYLKVVLHCTCLLAIKLQVHGNVSTVSDGPKSLTCCLIQNGAPAVSKIWVLQAKLEQSKICRCGLWTGPSRFHNCCQHKFTPRSDQCQSAISQCFLLPQNLGCGTVQEIIWHVQCLVQIPLNVKKHFGRFCPWSCCHDQWICFGLGLCLRDTSSSLCSSSLGCCRHRATIAKHVATW